MAGQRRTASSCDKILTVVKRCNFRYALRLCAWDINTPVQSARLGLFLRFQIRRLCDTKRDYAKNLTTASIRNPPNDNQTRVLRLRLLRLSIRDRYEKAKFSTLNFQVNFPYEYILIIIFHIKCNFCSSSHCHFHHQH